MNKQRWLTLVVLAVLLVATSPRPALSSPAAPSITSLSPSSATAGGPAFTLTVNGTGFIADATVRWHGSNRPTAYVSSTQLTASISATDIATAGTKNVDVFQSGGSVISNSKPFTINNPVPTITSLSPASATAGGPAFTLTVNGTGFVGASTVFWYGTTRPTTFVSSTQLTASISAADIATAGSRNVYVYNSPPGGGVSNVVSYPIVNPIPTITSLVPAFRTAGSPAFTLTVNGTGFVGTSTVRWNGLARTTTYVSPIQLTANISAADLATACSANVEVFNSTPGGGLSNLVFFLINNPVPNISSLSPASATVGGSAFTLTVNGTGLLNGVSTVRWNGSARTTTFVSSTLLTASISAADIATVGTANVTVFNSAPGGGTSNIETFPINNPVPTITSLSPASATAGGSAFILTVNGTGFVNGASTVRWNGSDRTTTYGSSTQLTASISAADIATAGTASVTVFSASGGGTSNTETFTIDDSHVYVYIPLVQR